MSAMISDDFALPEQLMILVLGLLLDLADKVTVMTNTEITNVGSRTTDLFVRQIINNSGKVSL